MYIFLYTLKNYIHLPTKLFHSQLILLALSSGILITQILHKQVTKSAKFLLLLLSL